ncbi:MAG: AmmeMemoRadiSam system protein B [Deltaproteobacteria bacterium]|nr:AmmeMemoRadiSam system protein B [Deltaproteobacteria bacterium]
MNYKVCLFTCLSACVLMMVAACDSPAREVTPKSGTKPGASKPVETIFEPVVAGSFYPGDKTELLEMMDTFLAKAKPVKPKGHILGFVEPHAGYIYSGPVAAWGYKLLKGMKFDRVVIMGPSHRAYTDYIGVLNKDYYSIPTGKVKIDKKACRTLLKDNSLFREDIRLFDREHSVEVEMPFLQRVMPGVKVVPLVFGNPEPETAKKAAQVLTRIFKGSNTLFIASSDLSHYHPYDHAVPEDKATLKLIEALDTTTLAAKWRTRERELCGFGPVMTLMYMAKMRKATAKIIHYANSGDTQGNKSRVVGYGVVAFSIIK